MNAFEIPGFQFSLNAAADLDWRRFVKVNADGLAEYASAATDPIVGVSYAEAPIGTPASITGSGIAMVEAGEEIAAGDFVTAGTDGKAAKGSEGAFIALTGATEGSLISVKLY